MIVEDVIADALRLRSINFAKEITPADQISRQLWQQAVENAIDTIRLQVNRPAFGLSESEISVHYHLPVSKFVELVKIKLRI